MSSRSVQLQQLVHQTASHPLVLDSTFLVEAHRFLRRISWQSSSRREDFQQDSDCFDPTKLRSAFLQIDKALGRDI